MSNNPYRQTPQNTGASSAPPTPLKAPQQQTTATFPEPNEPPPSYFNSDRDRPSTTTNNDDKRDHTYAGTSTLPVPTSPRRLSIDSDDHTTWGESDDESGIPKEERLSMEMDYRELPDGWRREFDGQSKHVFYVDTKSNPPRSIWVHPFDDPVFLASLPDDSPIRQQHLDNYSGQSQSGTQSQGPNKLQKGQPQQGGSGSGNGGAEEKKTFGRKLKDKMTGKTHEQRVAERKQQAELERKQYDQYLKRRQAIIDAQNNGSYQSQYAAPVGAYPGYGGAGGMYGGWGNTAPGYGNAYGPGYGSAGYNPYGYRGYSRGGRGYGGGMYGNSGMGGAGMGLAGGLLGGLLIGDLLF